MHDRSCSGFSTLASGKQHGRICANFSRVGKKLRIQSGIDNWQARQEFRDRQYAREEWLREHCVRDWSGGEYCRR
jgi:hypothetical protein